ncbi:MAG: methyltransferase domain-containing protein [Desulfobacter sp.]
MDVHIRMLKDTLQFQDDDNAAKNLGISSAAWPIFGVIWPSSEVLAHLMLDYEVDGKRILEVGCGIALASQVLNRRCADITATDLHPEAEQFLVYNTQLNKDKIIPFVRTGWADVKQGALGVFDLIIGSDLLYEKEHVVLLAEFVNQHAGRNCEVVIVDPGRGFKAKFSKKMTSLGYSHYQHQVENTDYLEKTFKGRILYFSR